MIVNADARCLPLGTGLVDLMIADPPYGINYQSAWRKDKSTWKAKIANDLTPFTGWFSEAFRVLNSTRSALVVFCRWDVAETFRQAIEHAGFVVKSQVIWDREVHGMGDLRASFAPCHDILWFAIKGHFTFPYQRPKSILRAQRISGAKLTHPNEKPEELYRQLITSLSMPGDLVVDPFVGSGACARVARNEHRLFIGLDISKDYCTLAHRRAYAAR